MSSDPPGWTRANPRGRFVTANGFPILKNLLESPDSDAL